MAMTMNSLLLQHGISPELVTFVRHNIPDAKPGRRVHEVWRDARNEFHIYQSVQNTKRRSAFSRALWAVFVSVPGGTMFVGLYRARYIGVLKADKPSYDGSGIDKAGTLDEYHVEHDDRLVEFEGLLFVTWGNQAVRIAQEADRNDKPIVALRTKKDDPEWPGYLNFLCQLSEIANLPARWVEILKAARGVYLLSCSDTKEQYVGQADGTDGFYGRWMQYYRDGHGGNVRLKLRDRPSDYQVCILQVAGSGERVADLESLWKRKLQSRDMGLNAN